MDALIKTLEKLKSELEKLMKYIEKYDIVIGSRWLKTSEIQNRFGYDFKILLIAKLNKIKYTEVPVKWIFNSNSKVKYQVLFSNTKRTPHCLF